MYKACSKCGKIHDPRLNCTPRKYALDPERKLRNSRKWANKSKEIREESQYLCAVCKDRGVYTYNNLEVHHIIKIKDDASLLLDNDNLICLCNEHHRQADNGELEPAYLQRLARDRERKISPL